MRTSPEREVDFVSRGIGEATNNEAEYTALIEGLKLALKRRVKDIAVRADSELVVRQMKGEYKVKHPHLRPLWAEAVSLSRKFLSFGIQHIPREENARADELANEALDRRILD